MLFYSIITNCADKRVTKSGYKVVSISPAMTEIIFALGAEHMLVGNTTFCDYPESAKNIYKVGDFSNPSLERIVGLDPDLVIINLPEQNRIKKELEKLNINIFVSSPKSLNDIYIEILRLGTILNKKTAADSLINYMKSNLQPVKTTTMTKVYVELSARPLVTIGTRSFLDELLGLAGGVNLFHDLDKEYPVVAQEEVVKRDPDIILLLHPGDIKQRLGWSHISAIEHKRVFKTLNQNHLLRPGPRLVLGLEALKRIIHE